MKDKFRNQKLLIYWSCKNKNKQFIKSVGQIQLQLLAKISSYQIILILKQYQKSNILQPSYYRTIMQTSHIPVITPITSDLLFEVQHIRLLGIFSLNVVNVEPFLTLALSDKYLLYFQNPKIMTPTHICPLNFDLKFQIVRETPWKDQNTPSRLIGIKFEKQLSNKSIQVLELYSMDFNLLVTWKNFLQSRLNQRNFHTLFKAKKQIGKGAFATVYLAERLEDKKLVAVKAFSKQRQFSGQQGKQSLVNQINLMRKFNHPNIIKLQGVFQTQNSIYVICQILEGRQLYDRLKNNEVRNEKDVLQIIRNILNALRALSQKRVIHRDLKPENIMFRKEGSNDLVICDFGLATLADEEKYLFVRCGTPGFVAPQIINIRDMSTKSEPISDVFSAGLIFHYLLFGRSIFNGKKYQQILTQNRACSFNFEKDLYRTIDPIIMDLLVKMLDVNPRTRINATEALRHPYFDMSRFEQKIIHHPMNECHNMIDQKQQDLATLVSRTKRMPTKTFEQNNSQALQAHKSKRSYRGSIYSQKQNENFHIGQIALVKKVSLMNEVETPLRRSKRNSVQERKVHYQPLRY